MAVAPPLFDEVHDDDPDAAAVDPEAPGELDAPGDDADAPGTVDDEPMPVPDDGDGLDDEDGDVAPDDEPEPSASVSAVPDRRDPHALSSTATHSSAATTSPSLPALSATDHRR